MAAMVSAPIYQQPESLRLPVSPLRLQPALASNNAHSSSSRRSRDALEARLTCGGIDAKIMMATSMTPFDLKMGGLAGLPACSVSGCSSTGRLSLRLSGRVPTTTRASRDPCD